MAASNVSDLLFLVYYNNYMLGGSKSDHWTRRRSVEKREGGRAVSYQNPIILPLPPKAVRGLG